MRAWAVKRGRRKNFLKGSIRHTKMEAEAYARCFSPRSLYKAVPVEITEVTDQPEEDHG